MLKLDVILGILNEVIYRPSSRSDPLPLIYHFLAEKVPLSYGK